MLLIFSAVMDCLSQPFIPGYARTIHGEELQYHSPQPDAAVSLLVRSEDSTRYIEWMSAPPLSLSPFLLLAGIDVNAEDPHEWKVFVNDHHLFTIASPTDTMSKTMQRRVFLRSQAAYHPRSVRPTGGHQKRIAPRR